MAQSWDYIAKLVVIGDSGTGKSSLTIRLCENRFVQQHDVTIGVEFGSQVVPVGPPASENLDSLPIATSQLGPEQKFMKLSLWDTAGQETYKSITRSYFRGASGALLVFDLSRRNTFQSVTGWLNDLRQIAEENIVVVLVGNKADLADESIQPKPSTGKIASNKREVSSEEAWEWCRANDVLMYVETSAKTGNGVEVAFLEVAGRIYNNIEAGKYDLNDRRSGVKGSGTTGRRGGRTNQVVLDRDNQKGSQGWTNSCC